MSTLLERMQKSGSIKGAAVLSESSFFNAKDVIPTDLPILNIAFSGSLDGGLIPGLTIFAGLSKSFKTLLGLYCMKAYFNKYPDAIALLYDSEFGITPDYLESNGIDPERVLHIPVEHVEQLKFDIVKRLDEVKRGDKVFIMLDSLGNLASKKEVEDAENEKSVADMSRAKAIRSLLRIITPHLTMKDLPCIVINHVYQEIGMFPKTIIPGGTAVTYAANQIFVIGKAQEKSTSGDKELLGYNFTINIEKSRFVKEKSKFPFLVTFDGGIQKYSGLLELATEANMVSVGKYSRSTGYALINQETGEVGDMMPFDKTQTSEFWNPILKSEKFKEHIRNKYGIAYGSLLQDEEESTELQLLQEEE